MKIVIIKEFEIVPGRILKPSPNILEVWDRDAIRAIANGCAIMAGYEPEKRITIPNKESETKQTKKKTNKKEE